MNCKKCGFQLTENAQFCKNCGTQVYNMSSENNNGILNSQISQNHIQSNIQQQDMSQQSKNSYIQTTMQQKSWTNSYNAQPINSTSNNSIKYIIIGIIVAVVIIGAIITIRILGSNKSNDSVTNSDDSSIVKNNSSYTVKFKNFIFKIPTNLIYETQTDAILLGDEEGTWTVYIEVIEGVYSQILTNKNQIQSAYQSMGYTSSVAVEKTIGGMPFITLEISKSGTNALLGLAKANSMNLFGITAYNMDNEYDYKLLETVSSILSSAEYSSETNNISVIEKPDMSVIARLAK